MTRLRRPTLSELQHQRDRFGFPHDDDELAQFRALAEGVMHSYDVVDALAAPTLPVTRPRGPGTPPADNPHGAWARICRVEGATDGPLAGRTVVLKDTVALAGVPMTNGWRGLAGYVPDEDATVVTRLLDAGATIVGKATCESLSMSAGSHTADSGPVRNPRRPEFSAGGSASGCGVLVATGEADLAVAGDQAGPIRIPAAWSGVYGLKPTHGLVPYTGVMAFEPTIDHLGPIARTPGDLALALDVMAGWDGLDPRGHDAVRPEAYAAACGTDVTGLRIGLLAEGFGIPGSSESAVDDVVRDAAQRLVAAGCTVTDVSVPLHTDGAHLAIPVYAEGGIVHGMHQAKSAVLGVDGHNLLGLVDHFGGALQRDPGSLPAAAVLLSYVGGHMQQVHHGRLHAKALNLRRTLRAAYDAAFAGVDVLALPTTPMAPTRLPDPDAPLVEVITRSLEMTANAVPFNLTGHPAVSVPAGTVDGLPVGLMLVAPRWRDARLLSVASAFERSDSASVW